MDYEFSINATQNAQAKKCGSNWKPACTKSQLLTLLLTASFYSANACGYFHIQHRPCQFGRAPNPYALPYGIVILSDFHFILCFNNAMCELPNVLFSISKFTYKISALSLSIKVHAWWYLQFGLFYRRKKLDGTFLWIHCAILFKWIIMGKIQTSFRRPNKPKNAKHIDN